jgi:SAM-dependent methyltransferase
MNEPGASPRRKSDAALWDRIWLEHPYRMPSMRAERAQRKVAAVIEAGLKLNESDRVLDLAVGSGHGLIEVADRVSHAARFFACDISAVAIALARTNLQSAGVEARLLRAQWDRLPFRAQSFDLVLAFMLPTRAVLREIDRVLAPNGKVFLVTLSRYSVTSIFYRTLEAVRPDPFGEQGNPTPGELVSMLRSRFVVEGWRILHSGADRPFSRAIDGAIAMLLPDWGRYVVARCAKMQP